MGQTQKGTWPVIYSTFEKQMNRIETAFGAKASNEEVAKLYWEQFQRIDDDLFVVAVSDMIMSLRQSPRVEDFWASIQKMKKSHAKPRNPENPDCVLCEDFGWVVPVGGFDPVKVVARWCDCKGGPEVMANRIRYAKQNPDPELADRILKTFAGVSAQEYRSHGFKLRDGRLQ